MQARVRRVRARGLRERPGSHVARSPRFDGPRAARAQRRRLQRERSPLRRRPSRPRRAPGRPLAPRPRLRRGRRPWPAAPSRQVAQRPRKHGSQRRQRRERRRQGAPPCSFHRTQARPPVRLGRSRAQPPDARRTRPWVRAMRRRPHRQRSAWHAGRRAMAPRQRRQPRERRAGCGSLGASPAARFDFVLSTTRLLLTPSLALASLMRLHPLHLAAPAHPDRPLPARGRALGQHRARRPGPRPRRGSQAPPRPGQTHE